jgi:hypothetical protein
MDATSISNSNALEVNRYCEVATSRKNTENFLLHDDVDNRKVYRAFNMSELRGDLEVSVAGKRVYKMLLIGA